MDKERKKSIRRVEAEKKRKIQELEAEIEEMQIDHAKTFGYAPPARKKDRSADMIMFVAGIIFLAAGLLWMFLNIRTASGPAIMKIGNLRFSRSIYSLPLIAGILGFFLCKKKTVPIILTIAGFAAAFVSLLLGADLSVFSHAPAVCVFMISLAGIGFILLAVVAARLLIREKKR